MVWKLPESCVMACVKIWTNLLASWLQERCLSVRLLEFCSNDAKSHRICCDKKKIVYNNFFGMHRYRSETWALPISDLLLNDINK